MARLLEIFPRPLLQELFIQLSSYIRMIIAGLIFFTPLQKKDYYAHRLAAGFFCCLVVCILSAYVRFLSDFVLFRCGPVLC